MTGFNREQGFGFIDLMDIPPGDYSSGKLAYDKIDWAVTKDYIDKAKNHCGAVLVTNLALYFSAKGYNNLLVNNSKDDTFVAVHRIVGNGPIISLTKKARKFFNERAYALEYEGVKSYKDMKDAIDKGQPLGLLLSSGIFNWHWIMVVGWKEDTSQRSYLRIVDSWNRTDERFYKVDSGSRLWLARKYWIEPL